jgi:hypothetical protein
LSYTTKEKPLLENPSTNAQVAPWRVFKSRGALVSDLSAYGFRAMETLNILPDAMENQTSKLSVSFERI